MFIRSGLNFKRDNGFTITYNRKEISYRFRLRLKPFHIFAEKIRHGKTMNKSHGRYF